MSDPPSQRLLGLVANLFQVLGGCATLGLVAYAAIQRDEAKLDGPTVAALVTVLLTGLILAALGLRSRYADGNAFGADRGKHATMALYAGLLMTSVSVVIFVILL
ncbi:hypothetical protein [Spirillospora sp. CA-294931]|uniref:hypothetical protein n=1 Tax=Spirillospora sp. CA-294931 TaxID=3240042 RepID=UPI003D8A8C4F